MRSMLFSIKVTLAARATKPNRPNGMKKHKTEMVKLGNTQTITYF